MALKQERTTLGITRHQREVFEKLKGIMMEKEPLGFEPDAIQVFDILLKSYLKLKTGKETI